MYLLFILFLFICAVILLIDQREIFRWMILFTTWMEYKFK